jgi:hypothetical protein
MAKSGGEGLKLAAAGKLLRGNGIGATDSQFGRAIVTGGIWQTGRDELWTPTGNQ